MHTAYITHTTATAPHTEAGARPQYIQHIQHLEGGEAVGRLDLSRVPDFNVPEVLVHEQDCVRTHLHAATPQNKKTSTHQYKAGG